jgi:hypothetical protein
MVLGGGGVKPCLVYDVKPCPPEKLIELWYKVDMQKISNKNANRSLNVTGESDIDIKKMGKVLNDDCKKVIFVMAMDQKVVEFTQNIAAKKIQNWWRLATGYRIILNKIWDAYQRDEFERLDCLNLDLKFLHFVGNASVMHIDHYIYVEAVHWYLRYRSPCVYTKEFIDIFYDVEQEEEDYDYRDWKTSRKWLIFARYINSCGGLDEWNWLQVFYGIMLEGDGGDDQEKELFSCDTWLSTELKRKENGTFERKQIVYMTNGVSPTLRLIRGPNEDICTKNYFLLAEVLTSSENMSLFDLDKLLKYFIIDPSRDYANDNIENMSVFEEHIIDEIGNLMSVSIDEHFLDCLCLRLLDVVFKASNNYEDYRFTDLICDKILASGLANQVLFKNVMICGNTQKGKADVFIRVMVRLGLMNVWPNY